MKKLFFTIWIIIGTSIASYAQGLGIGGAMNDFSLLNLTNNQTTSVASLKGSQGLVVIFTGTNCPYVKIYESRINQLISTYQSKGINFVLVNSNNPNGENNSSAVQNYLKSRSISIPYLQDPSQQLADHLGASKNPEVFLLKSNGNGLVLKYKGAIDDNPQVASDVSSNYLVDALQTLLNNTGIKVSEKKPTGCMIQR